MFDECLSMRHLRCMAPCKTRECEILVWQLAVVDSITFADTLALPQIRAFYNYSS